MICTHEYWKIILKSLAVHWELEALQLIGRGQILHPFSRRGAGKSQVIHFCDRQNFRKIDQSMNNMPSRYNLIEDTQHGFRSKISCPTNLLDFSTKSLTYTMKTKPSPLSILISRKRLIRTPNEKSRAPWYTWIFLKGLRNWITGTLNGSKLTKEIVSGLHCNWSPTGKCSIATPHRALYERSQHQHHQRYIQIRRRHQTLSQRELQAGPHIYSK